MCGITGYFSNDSKVNAPLGRVPAVGILTKFRGGYGCSIWAELKLIIMRDSNNLFIVFY